MVGETTTVSPLLGDSMDLEEHGRKREKKRRRRRRERERERGVEEGGWKEGTKVVREEEIEEER